MKTFITITTIILSAGLVACDGPIETHEVVDAQIPQTSGVSFADPALGQGAQTEEPTNPNPAPAAPAETEDTDGESEVVGQVVDSELDPATTPTETDESDEDAGDASQPTEPTEPPPAPKYTGSPATPWAGQSTGGLPKFGINCRLATDDVFESATNSMVDDTLYFTTHDANNATVDIMVQDASGQVLAVTADISRALTGRSFRNATGTADLGDDSEAVIMDGTFCFENKATAGVDVLAEFSFIINDGNQYRSVAGILMVPGSVIGALGGLSIDADSALDIDLR